MARIKLTLAALALMMLAATSLGPCSATAEADALGAGVEGQPLAGVSGNSLTPEEGAVPENATWHWWEEPLAVVYMGNETDGGAVRLAARGPHLRRLAGALYKAHGRRARILTGRIPTGKVALQTALNRISRLRMYSRWIALLQFSGWRPIMEQSIQVIPLTVLACTNNAFARLPMRFQQQLQNRQVATRFLQYHMLNQLWTYESIQYFLPSPYPTAMGPYAWRQQPPRGQRSVRFGPYKNTPFPQQSLVVGSNISGKDLYLVIMHGIATCMIPPGVFR